VAGRNERFWSFLGSWVVRPTDSNDYERFAKIRQNQIGPTVASKIGDSSDVFAIEELLSMAISKDSEDNPDPPPEFLEDTQADIAAGVFAYLDFLYGNKRKDNRP
jgi:hypothetical protein